MFQLSAFAAAEQHRQEAYRASSESFSFAGRQPGLYRGNPRLEYLPAQLWSENLFPGIRDEASTYFSDHHIAWHSDAHHVRSSQVCCLNFIMPLARNELVLVAVLKPVLGDIKHIVPIETGRLAAFEWISETDYLNEGGAFRRRGRYCTSVDAAILLERFGGDVEIILLEWKYTESYQTKMDNTRRDERIRRYGNIAFWPNGPLYPDLRLRVEQLFYEPVYQLFRLQMLAYQLERARYRGITRAHVVCVSPRDNVSLSRVTAPALMPLGIDVFTVWPSLLVEPSRFIHTAPDVLFNNAALSDERPTPGLYDCMIVDEAHRGYVLDAELREEDLSFRPLDEYLSQYRRVLDYFDAVKIGLTATPALHTTQIFGPPVFSYGYRQAVVDGWLIDHLPPRRITTALAQTGIKCDAGEEVQIIDPRSGQVDLFTTPDQVDFEVQQFNKRVYTREFNRVVAETLASEIPPNAPGKTLIFAARDDHADMLVRFL